jgi:hypothetical protein
MLLVRANECCQRKRAGESERKNQKTGNDVTTEKAGLRPRRTERQKLTGKSSPAIWLRNPREGLLRGRVGARLACFLGPGAGLELGTS